MLVVVVFIPEILKGCIKNMIFSAFLTQLDLSVLVSLNIEKLGSYFNYGLNMFNLVVIFFMQLLWNLIQDRKKGQDISPYIEPINHSIALYTLGLFIQIHFRFPNSVPIWKFTYSSTPSNFLTNKIENFQNS